MSTTVLPPDRTLSETNHEHKYRPSSRKTTTVRLEDGGKEFLECWGYKSTVTRSVLYHFIGILTAGLGYLVLSWYPTWAVSIRKRQCGTEEADAVVLKDSHGIYYCHPIRIDLISDNAKLICGDIAEFGLLTENFRNGVKLTSSASFCHLAGLNKDVLRKGQGNGSAKISAMRFFDHQHIRYAWHHGEDSFKRLSGLSTTTTCGELQSKFLGVSEEERRQKLRFFGQNTIDIEVKSVFRLLIEEVLNPFYCFQIFCIVLWALDDYYIYASCVLAISIFGISLSLYETRKQRLRLREMVRKSCSSEKLLVMGTDKQFTPKSPELLVPGDVIVIPKLGCLMSCDAVLLEGNCIMNEGVLTGESAPVTKVALSSGQEAEVFLFEEHKKHILFHGTTVVQTRYYENARVLAVVCQTGFYTVKGDLVRSILFPKPTGLKFYRDAMRLVGVMAGIAGCGMAYSVYVYVQREETLKDIIVRALDLITIVVPPALPAALTVGVVYSQRRLKRLGIFCISPSRINVCGKIKLVCFDKTGTLTEEGIGFMGVIPVNDGVLGDIVENMGVLAQSQPLVVGMASCHSLTLIEENLCGDPLDMKLFEATRWTLHEPQHSPGGAGAFNSLFPTTVMPPNTQGLPETEDERLENHIGIVRQFPFSSGLQRMSVITRAPGRNNFCAYVKGAPEKIASLCREETVPSNFQKVLHLYTHQGFRVIALGFCEMDPKISWHQTARLKRETVECDLTFAGLMIMRNSLKVDSSAVIAELSVADIQSVMITGDNMLTAISVARECGMVRQGEDIVVVDALPPDEETNCPAQITWRFADSTLSLSETSLSVDRASPSNSSSSSRGVSASEYLITMERPRYHFAVSGKSFGVLVQHFSSLLPWILVRGVVFARFSPEQKTQLVEKYIELDYITGMVGDGANDCGALKAAHAGISLSEAEASVASPFTSNRNTIQCVPAIIREGRCALVTSFGVFRYMALYSIVQFVSVLILYQKQTILADPHFLYLDMVITTVVAVLMGYTKPFDRLVKRRPHGSLMAPSVIVSIFLHMLLIAGFQSSVVFYLQSQPWFSQTNTVVGHLPIKRCWETTVLFIVAAFQDLILAFVLSKGRPYRKSIYTNELFLVALIILVLLTSCLLLYVPEWLQSIFELEYDIAEPRIVFRTTILAIVASNFCVAIIIEEWVIGRMWFKRCLAFIRQKTHSKSRFKSVHLELAAAVDWPPVGGVTFEGTKPGDSLRDQTEADEDPDSTKL